MKWSVLLCAAIALLSITACSGPPSPEPQVATVAHATAATPVPPADQASGDLDKFQGTWHIESSYWNGVREPEAARSVTIHFQGDKLIVVDRDGNRREETIKLMPESNPKAIDCWSKPGGEASPGIYSLEGNTIRWCSAGGAKRVRPTSFASEPGSKRSLMILKRSVPRDRTPGH